MRNLQRLAASLLAAFAVFPCFASDIGCKPDVSIVLEKPNRDFIFGQPIPLHVVFQNNLNHDIEIEGFCPEDGFYSAVHGVQRLSRTGCTTARRSVGTTTRVDLERLSGKSPEAGQEFEIGKAKARSFILKAGASKMQSFDLMKVWYAAPDSPGRFQVSLLFKIKAVHPAEARATKDCGARSSSRRSTGASPLLPSCGKMRGREEAPVLRRAA